MTTLTPEKKLEILVDLLFKDVAAGKASSSEANSYFEELINSRSLVFPSQIVADEDLIPETAEAVTNVIEEIVDLELLPIPGTNSKAFYHPNLVGIIPFNFGDSSSYLYSLKKQDNTPIAFGENDWFFNNKSGVLLFMDGFPDGVSPELPPKISCFKYVGRTGVIAPSSIVNSLVSNDASKLLSAAQGPVISSLVANSTFETTDFDTLKERVDTGTLKPGKLYLFDYQTIYQIPETTDININVHNGQAYGDMAAEENPIVPTEGLVVTAVAPNRLSPFAFSVNYPDDLIYYDIQDTIVEDGVTNRPGKIYRRIDNKRNINLPCDWRVERRRRRKVDNGQHVLDPAHDELFPGDPSHSKKLAHGLNINAFDAQDNASHITDAELYVLPTNIFKCGRKIDETAYIQFFDKNVLFNYWGTSELWPQQTYWELGPGWLYFQDQHVICDGTQEAETILRRVNCCLLNKKYKVRFNLDGISSGNVKVRIGTAESEVFTAQSDATFELICDVQGADFEIVASSDFSGIIKDIGCYPEMEPEFEYAINSGNYHRDLNLTDTASTAFKDLPIIRPESAKNVECWGYDFGNVVFNPISDTNPTDNAKPAIQNVIINKTIDNVTFNSSLLNVTIDGSLTDSIFLSDYIADSIFEANSITKGLIFSDRILRTKFRDESYYSMFSCVSIEQEFSGIRNSLIGGYLVRNKFALYIDQSIICGYKSSGYQFIDNTFSHWVYSSYLAADVAEAFVYNRFNGFFWLACASGQTHRHITLINCSRTWVPAGHRYHQFLGSLHSCYMKGLDMQGLNVNVLTGAHAFGNLFGGAKCMKNWVIDNTAISINDDFELLLYSPT